MDFYHAGMRDLQDQFEGRQVADRLEEHRLPTTFNDDDRQLIHAVPFFFLATATSSNVDCSFNGGAPGFVPVVSDTELVWPDYDGNRMYRSLGSIRAAARVGLLSLASMARRLTARPLGYALTGKPRLMIDQRPFLA